MKYITRYNHKRRHVSSLRHKGRKKLRRTHQPVADVYEPSDVFTRFEACNSRSGTFNYYLFDGRKRAHCDCKCCWGGRCIGPGWALSSEESAISTRITGGFVNKKMFDLPNRNGTIWIANDAWSTPLKMIAETKLGPAEAVLTKRYREDGAIVFAEDS